MMTQSALNNEMGSRARREVERESEIGTRLVVSFILAWTQFHDGGPPTTGLGRSIVERNNTGISGQQAVYTAAQHPSPLPVYYLHQPDISFPGEVDELV